MLESRSRPVIDSDVRFETAIAGKYIPREIRERQRLLSVNYLSTDGVVHSGQIVVHEEMVERVGLIFRKLLEIDFPVKTVLPASRAGWDDDVLMKQNISSGFNLRTIKNSSTISPHGYGLAFDVNPLFNPCFYQNGEVDPPGAVYDQKRRGTLVRGSEAVRYIESLHLTWGGSWDPKDGPVDTQHIEDRARWLQLTGRKD